jgi:uncharacterized protein
MSRLNVRRLNRIMSMLFNEMKGLDDEQRDLPIRWNVCHMYSSSQLAKILALKRGVDLEIAALTAALHDIAVVITKKTEGHAEKAEKYVEEAIEKFNNSNDESFPKITPEETELIVAAIIKHSDKEEYSDDVFIELLKDVDSLDRYLHGVRTEGAYLERSKRVLKEFGIE